MKSQKSGRKERVREVRMRFSLGGKEQKDVLRAASALNCDCRDGVLKSAKRWKRYKWSDDTEMRCNISSIICMFMIREYNQEEQAFKDRLGVVDRNGNLYVSMHSETYNKKFICIANGLDLPSIDKVGEEKTLRIAVFSKKRCILVNGDGSVTSLPTLNYPTSGGAYYRHRLFVAVKPSGVAYSEPNNPSVFKQSLHGGGCIYFTEMGSNIVAMKVFKDKLYLFFKDGIMMLENCGSPNDFKTKKIAYGGGIIFGKTVCVGNNAIYFMAKDGAYRFDGAKVEPMFSDFIVPPYAERGGEGGAVFQGKVYLRYATNPYNYTVIVMYEDGKDAFYMSDLEGLSVDQGEVMFKDFDGVLAKLDNEGDMEENAFFGNAETDFGVMGRKTLRKLIFKGEGNFLLTITCDGRDMMYEVDCMSGVGEVLLTRCSERFIFNIDLMPGAKIEEMTAIFLTRK